MQMKHCLLAAGALLLMASLTATSGLTQDVKPADPKKAVARRAIKTDPADGKLISPYSLAGGTAMSRQDCKPNNLHKDGLGIHGHYRTYGQWDPELKSIEGRKQYEACVKRGLDPTPWFAFGQRMMIGLDGNFFGKTKEDCLRC